MSPGAIALAASLAFVPPEPGTYELPVIDAVSDHEVVESGGRETTLFALAGGRLAVVSFVYFSCADREGCPVAMSALGDLDRRLAADGELARRTRLVTISFDPERDTPEQLAKVRRLYAPRTDWSFATTRGERELAPILADFNQTVAKLRYQDGRGSGLFRHVLKVFLIDPERRVRNIYSAGFLYPGVVLNDLRTLAAE